MEIEAFFHLKLIFVNLFFKAETSGIFAGFPVDYKHFLLSFSYQCFLCIQNVLSIILDIYFFTL